MWTMENNNIYNVFIFFLQRLSYAKKDSDVIAKLKGTFQERTKEKKKEPKKVTLCWIIKNFCILVQNSNILYFTAQGPGLFPR